MVSFLLQKNELFITTEEAGSSSTEHQHVFPVGNCEMRGIQLVVIHNLTTRCQKILHMGF